MRAASGTISVGRTQVCDDGAAPCRRRVPTASVRPPRAEVGARAPVGFFSAVRLYAQRDAVMRLYSHPWSIDLVAATASVLLLVGFGCALVAVWIH
jgi:hypothetical protein